ncbi:MAG: hypothetical protein IT577_15265 [Verrucomicrobiae bacterium]|nr:hypothetical protein [Verrucomicrobiae bacterium]
MVKRPRKEKPPQKTPQTPPAPKRVRTRGTEPAAATDPRIARLKRLADRIASDQVLRAGDPEKWAEIFVKLAGILVWRRRDLGIGLERLSIVIRWALGQMAAPELLRNREWLERFAYITLGCAQTLRESARSHEEQLRQIAQELPEWPVCMRDSKESAASARRLVKTLAVGTANIFAQIKIRGKLTKPVYEWLRSIWLEDEKDYKDWLDWPVPRPEKKTVQFYRRKYVGKHPCPARMTPGVYSQRVEDALDSIFGQYARLRSRAAESAQPSQD